MTDRGIWVTYCFDCWKLTYHYKKPDCCGFCNGKNFDFRIAASYDPNNPNDTWERYKDV